MKKLTRIFGILLLCLALVCAFSVTVFANEAADAPAPDASTSTVAENPETTVDSSDAEAPTTGDTSSESTVGGAEAPEEAEEEEDPKAEADVYGSKFFDTALSLLPPVIAIALALITKEVYSSLFIGILAGGLLNAFSDKGFNFENMFNSVMNEGLTNSLADAGNVGILIFLVILGVIVVMMNRAGGSRAYGEWASKRIKSRKGAQASTFGLGALIFVDDYFNCLTVGSVMRPLTDKQRVSRAKLAYLIDATAAPICIIAPVSSWAAAVSGTVDGVNGLDLFIRTIPYNLYALLTIAMVLFIAISGKDYGPMRKHEVNAKENGDLFSGRNPEGDSVDEADSGNAKGRVIDLLLPVIVLIAFCVVGMLYTGGLFNGVDLITAFGDCSAGPGLALGSMGALLVIVAYFLCRRVLSFKQCMEAIPEGFKQMVPAILILTLAWGLNGMTGSLGAKFFVSEIVAQSQALMMLLPAILFVVAIFLSFSTGTSWGTFGILIPIVTGVFADTASELPTLMVIAISACLAGAVCGDHSSPISDTTIMASAGAKCDHVTHVSTQLPYALTVAAVSFVGYLLAGFVQNVFVILGVSLVLLFAVLFFLTKMAERRDSKK